jgi:hypothetical protein
MSRDMDWETIIPRSTISICPTMMPTEEPQNLENHGRKHTRTRTRPPIPLMMPGRRSKGKGSKGIADELAWNRLLRLSLASRKTTTKHFVVKVCDVVFPKRIF